MNLTDYSLRESIGITDRFLGSGSLNTVLFISAKILVGAGTFVEWKTWIGEADLIIWSDPEIVKQAGIRTKDRIHEVENQDYIKEVLKRFGKGKKTLYLLAESEEELEKLESDLVQIREDLTIVGRGVVSGIREEWDDEANRINAVAPAAIISRIQFERQGRLMDGMKKILNADLWLALDYQMVLGSRKVPFLKRLLGKWYHHLFQRQMDEYYHAKEKEQNEGTNTEDPDSE